MQKNGRSKPLPHGNTVATLTLCETKLITVHSTISLPKAIESITSFFEDKAHRKKQGAGIVSYVKPLSRSNDVFGKNRIDLAIALTLEGRANCICALLRVGRTYVNVSCGAIALAVVIYAVLYRAIDALDVLFALAIIVHNNLYSVLNFKIQIPTFRSLTRRVGESRLLCRQYYSSPKRQIYFSIPR